MQNQKNEIPETLKVAPKAAPVQPVADNDNSQEQTADQKSQENYPNELYEETLPPETRLKS